MIYANVNPEKLVRWQDGRNGKPFIVSLALFSNNIGNFLNYYPESRYESQMVKGYVLKDPKKFGRDYEFDQETVNVLGDDTLYFVVYEKP